DESPVGREVRVNGVGLRVLGVLRAKGANMTGMDQDDLVVAPWTTVKFRINGTRQALAGQGPAGPATGQVNTTSQRYPTLQPQLYVGPSPSQAATAQQLVRFVDLDDIYVSANSPEEMPLATDQIRRLLRERHRLRDGQPDDFRIRNLTESARTLGETRTF